MTSFSRREFLEQSLLAMAAAPAAQEAAPDRRVGANDRLRVAVLGVNGQGRVHVNKWLAMSDVEIGAVCDPDERVAGAAIDGIEKKTRKKASYYADLRKLYEDKSIDAVSIATPNHWHVLASLWAVQAGKDVYVEKPLSHNLWEGRRLVEAARKHGRMVQMGNYPRSLAHMREGVAFLRSGKLGRIRVARGICYNKRGSIGKKPDGQPPAGVDYDLWLGPAPLRPFNPNRFHYNWHWNWEYGGGEIANNGIYQLDTARWGIGKDVHPRFIASSGGRVGYEDDGQTPNTQVAVYDYGDVKIVQEIRGLPTQKFPPDIQMGNVFHCEGGYVAMGIQGSAAWAADGSLIQRFAGQGDHWQNFVDAVKTRKREVLNSEVLEGHLSTSLCHLANISFRLGRTEKAAGSRPFDGDPGAETWERTMQHLAENEVDPKTAEIRKGPVLEFDGAKEKFVNAPEADALLKREYRAPYVVE
jgi:predicted dehydrogenase